MKKYLFILLSVISLTAFSEVTYEEAVIENLQDMGSNVSDIQFQLSQFFSPDPENGYYLSLRDLFYLSLYETDLPSIPRMLGDIVDQNVTYYPYLESIDSFLSNNLNQSLDFIPSIFFHLTDNWQDISNGFAQNHADLVNINNSIHDLEVKQEGYLSGVSAGIEDIGNGLSEIIEILQIQNGSSGSDFPKEEIGYYQLENYGKNVSINHLPFQSLETTGEYNKDVHRMLLALSRLGSSQNNASLSILTNVQLIVTALSQDAEGQDKLEKDLEDKEYQATKAEAELSGVTSQNWDSSFTPPRYLSDVHGRLSIGLSDPGLPSEITVMDKFYYETQYFTLEIDPLSFQIPQSLVDLANYGRIVFGFVYWTLTFFLALYLFRLWVRLYMYVSNTLINR